ncbi:uncharacterized protein LOC114294625 [Camellia sinensis]|uniref:uncharacterized protein LOC114294625 n=1 Tax=Camellia sinensis TaxID=4442 RepID=UPI0010360943|nr:uncharacterized protein LOC114294625 [Camellia sinensis]
MYIHILNPPTRCLSLYPPTRCLFPSPSFRRDATSLLFSHPIFAFPPLPPPSRSLPLPLHPISASPHNPPTRCPATLLLATLPASRRRRIFFLSLLRTPIGALGNSLLKARFSYQSTIPRSFKNGFLSQNLQKEKRNRRKWWGKKRQKGW